MGQQESKLAFKNKVFRLAGENSSSIDDDQEEFPSTIPTESEFWDMFWDEPVLAEDVFAMLSYSDIKSIREANKLNFLNLIRILCLKLIKTAQHEQFPDNNNGKSSVKTVLNCIRCLNRLLPFLFEMGAAWESEVNHLFWSLTYNNFGGAGRDGDDFTGASSTSTVGTYSSGSGQTGSSLGSSSIHVNINQNVHKASPTSTDAQVGKNPPSQPLGHLLVTVLVDLLFTKNFTLEKDILQKGTDFKIWEVGVGSNGKYSLPNPELDSNRLEVLRLLTTLSSQSLYLTPKSVVSKGSRFLTVLVSTIPRLKSLTLLCSLLNVVCRSCKTSAELNGLSYSAPENNNQYSNTKYQLLRKSFVSASLQLLTVMLVYPLPTQDLQFLHQLKMLPNDEKPHNLVRSYLGRLHKENELSFIYTSFIGLLSRPMEQALEMESNPFNLLKSNFTSAGTLSSSAPTSSNGTTASGNYSSSFPSLSIWSTEIIILLWELIQCNKNFKKFVYSKRIQELMVLLVYYIKFYKNNELWKPSLIRIICYLVLYLTSDELVLSKLLTSISSNYYSNKLPNFYKLSTSNISSNLTYRDFLVIQISNMLTQDDFDVMISPNLFEYLYNLIPIKNTNDPTTTKTKVSLSYYSSMAILNVVSKFNNAETMNDQLKQDLLALVVRAIAQACCRFNKESRTLMFVITKHEKIFNELFELVENTKYNNEKSSEGLNPEEQQQQGQQQQENPQQQQRGSPEANSGATTPITESGDPLATVNEGDEDSPSDDETNGPLSEEFEKSLRPRPPTGMSHKAKSKLPVDGPLTLTWAGYRALKIILCVINLVKEEISDVQKTNKAELIEMLIKIEKIPNFQEKVQKFSISEFLSTKTKLERLKFNWSSLSLGWYESILWGVIFYDNLNISKEASTSTHSWFNKRNSTISLKEIASNWGFSWKSSSPTNTTTDKQVESFHFDQTILQLNIWNGTAVKLFKIKQPIMEKPLVDVNNLMRRFRLNSAASINTLDSRNSITSPRHNSISEFNSRMNSGVNSPNQLTPINSRQSFSTPRGTPRNSVSVHRESVHLNLSRQNSYNNA